MSFSSSLNNAFGKMPAIMRGYRLLSLLAVIAITAFSITGIRQHFTVDISPESWFPERAGPVEMRDVYRRQFGSDESVYLVYRHKSGDAFSAEALKSLEKLHKAIEQASLQPEPNELARITQVDSLFNARYQIAEGDTLIAKKLIGADFPATDAEREQRRNIADSQNSFARLFYSPDYQYGALTLKTNIGTVPKFTEAASESNADNLLLDDGFGLDLDTSLEVDPNATVEDVQFKTVQLEEYHLFMNELRALIETPEYADFDFYYVGNPVTSDFVMNGIIEALALILAMVGIVVVLLWALFRSFSAVVWSILIVGIANIWALGLGAWMGLVFSSMLVLTFMLTLAVGIASCIHVLSSYTHFKREGESHEQALALAYKKTGYPILLTSFTTMVGMFSLTMADMPIIIVFGTTSALAIAVCFVLILCVLPILLDFWHPHLKPLSATNNSKGKKPLVDIQPLLNWIAGYTKRRSKAIVIAYLGVFAFLIIGSMNINIDSNIAGLARESAPLKKAMNIVDKEMMGALGLEIYMDFNQADALQDPEVLKAIDQMQSLLATQYGERVVKTLSLANIVKDSSQVMHGDDQSYHLIPDDPRLSAQLLYMFNNANPDDRRDVVSDDYSKSHITLFMKNGGTDEYISFFELLDNDVETVFSPLKTKYPEMDVQVTGTFHLMWKLMDHIAWTQFKSFSLAFGIIALLMMVALGSYQAGLISMIPNMLPAIFTFGVMGWLDISLDTDTLIVAPIIIGIAVDDTIHFLTHYRQSWLEHGDVDLAVSQTLREVGQAVAFTSLILGLGFGVLGFAGYLGIAKPGLFGAAAIFVALLSDLLFLPALMYWLKPKLGRQRHAKQVEPAI
ncbi:MMPL family transporter [Spongiibacter sp. KMU-158]|uniref:MMPL family transporter n=1 Tax=Spongiibacter pelagi TaxID=2760804 RepID=A0A927GWJ8_9GAMM|nr:MMPL family transporter [Spongiibacter pelagi]MBD2859535.1 MMPL family transporter [Spongiibacter pelagi]